MPGDTLISQFHDTIARQAADSLFGAHSLADRTADEPVTAAGFFAFLIIFCLLVGGPFIVNRLLEAWRRRRAIKDGLAELDDHFGEHDVLLQQFNGYYKGLPLPLRRKFMERVVWFMNSKQFECVDLEFEERMPWLISAAAVQISFGLDKFLLDFFDTIFILRHNYSYGVYEKPFEGHVNSQGIYLSWDNFLRGFDDYTDGDNVGIHEMSHALAYVNFMAGANNDQDPKFIQRFYQFSAVARPIFNEMQNGKPNMLNNYAATNYNEFSAVAVETFFEKSLQLKLELPDLYDALCRLLNQDPLKPDKILNA
jgi:Mlc titration factor MtfA (ptsG expression regulator)